MSRGIGARQKAMLVELLELERLGLPPFRVADLRRVRYVSDEHGDNERRIAEPLAAAVVAAVALEERGLVRFDAGDRGLVLVLTDRGRGVAERLAGDERGSAAA